MSDENDVGMGSENVGRQYIGMKLVLYSHCRKGRDEKMEYWF